MIFIFRTTGDGNCLYNACSIALIGDETLATCLRCLTSIELYQYAHFYASHPVLDYLESQKRISNLNNAFAKMLSFKAADLFEKDNHLPSVYREALHIAKNFRFSSFLCVLAVSSVIGLPIETYFPTNGNDEILQPNSCESLFNCTVYPRISKSTIHERIHIFRCASLPVEFLKTQKFPEAKNHYVPLISDIKVGIKENAVLHKSKKQQEMANTGSLQSKEGLQSRYFVSVMPNDLPSTKAESQIKIHNKPVASLKRKGNLVQSTMHSLVFKRPRCSKEQTNNNSLVDVTMPCSSEDQDINIENNVASCTKDVGTFYRNVSSISDCKKYELLCNTWKPDPSFVFPRSSTGRKFQYQWLETFPWLRYSAVCDGAFCINCVLFAGETTHNSSKLIHLFKLPLNDWANACQRLKDHYSKSKVHATATLRAGQFKQCMENKVTPINVQYDKAISAQVQLNREKLKPIIEGIITCGRQNFGLRGHRDDAKHHDESKNNPGNLQAFLSFLVRCGKNKIFADHFANAPRSATYKSKTTQNEIIKICGALITESLSSEVKSAKYFSVLPDEATDISNIEQMSIVLRFVDQASLVREEFLGFVACDEGLRGDAIARKVLTAVENLGLDMSNCRGQGYDGAANMSGKCSGAATIIQRQYPQARYVHCKSHVLNLAVASACSLQVVQNMMTLVRSVSAFFNVHPKRFQLLTQMIQEILPTARHERLIDVCRTRWLARIDGLDVFIELFEAIVICLEKVKDNYENTWSSNSVKDASGLFYGTVAFEFIVCLVAVSRMLEVTRPLTKQLQSVSLDTTACANKVSLLYAMLLRIRGDIDKLHDQWYAEAVEIAEKVGTPASKPRIARIQSLCANTPSDSPSEYFRRVITIPFLDNLKAQIQTRFSDQNLKLFNAYYALPQNLQDSCWQEKFSMFISMFESDLPEPRYLSTELKSWESYWEMFHGRRPSTISDLLPFIDKMIFPNIYTALQIAATIPVTTCSCERSISVLRRLKTYLRNSMTESRMNGLALLHVHREVSLDVDSIIDRFARQHPRRMKLLDILNSDPI